MTWSCFFHSYDSKKTISTGRGEKITKISTETARSESTCETKRDSMNSTLIRRPQKKRLVLPPLRLRKEEGIMEAFSKLEIRTRFCLSTSYGAKNLA